MKKICTFIVALCAVSALWANGVVIDGINYIIAGDSAVVTYTNQYSWNGSSYSGDITIPDSVTYYSHTYPVTSVGAYAFSYCKSLTSVVIPNTIKSIGGYAFQYCSALQTLSIPNSVTSIGTYAFLSCTNLESIILGNYVKRIEASAFAGCSKFPSISIPNSVIYLGERAFDGCKSLSFARIGGFVTSDLKNIFVNCSKLSSLEIDASNTRYSSKDGVLFNYAQDTLIYYLLGNTRTEYTIPNTVTSIADDAFYDCNYLTTVVIPNSVTSIGRLAFYSSNALTTIDIPNSVNTIEEYTFAYCNKLTTVTIGNSVEKIMNYAFYESKNLSSVSLGTSVKCIGEYAFTRCLKLSSITIPNSVTQIENGAFAGCSALTTATLGSSVASLGDGVFGSCTSLSNIIVDQGNTHFRTDQGVLFNYAKDTILQYPIGNKNTSYTIPSTVLCIGGSAFASSNFLETITIPNSVTTIGKRAFESCSKIKSITIPNSVVCIETQAFDQCIALSSIIIPNSVKSIGDYAFGLCPKLTSITLGTSLKNIGYSAFRECTALISISIPDSVTDIGNDAFLGCTSLESIILNSSLQNIGMTAFHSCSAVKHIISKAITPPACGQSCFSGISTKTPVYVPFASQEAYKTAKTWNGFYNILPLECYDNKPIQVTDSLYTCNGESIQWKNETYQDDGVYTKIVSNQFGCDSIIYTLVLGNYPTYSKKDTTTILEGDSILLGKGTSKQSIVYPTITSVLADTLQTIHGCDSIINHYVIVRPMKDFVYSVNDTNGGYIVSSHVIGKYPQWTSISIEAVANDGYQFICWENGLADNPRTISLSGNTSVMAYFYKGKTHSEPAGILDGAFSVAEGRCVKFSRGNLQYNVTQGTHACADTTTQPGTWRFAEHQYDIAGANNLSRSATYNGWIDLFYYGTSGYNGMMPYSSNYHSDHMDDMGFILTTNYDFGEYNAISNGGNEPGLWRLFTVAEWQYIMNNREHAKDLSGHATVCGVKGVLIFPDVYIYKLGKTSYTFYPRSTSDWTKASNLAAYNVYNETTWKQVEADGAVFLPFEKPLRSTWNTKSPTGAEQLYMDEDNCFYMTPCRGNLPSVEYIGFSEQDIYAAISTNSKGVSVRLISTKFYKPELPKFEVRVISADTTMGSVDGAGKYEQDSAINLTAMANYGYRFTQWNDGNKDNPRQIVVTKDTSFIAYFEKESYTITTNATNGTIEAESTALYKDTITLTAAPNVGYHFAQWQDGNTDNPRKIEIVQDTTMTALFVKNYNGMCGDCLYWAYEDGKLQITGKGAMYNFEDGKSPWVLFKDSIITITLPTDLTTIGKYAFAGCTNITEIVMGANVEEIGAYAFASCKKLTNIACFAVNPPKSETSTFATYKATLVVVCESQTAYEDDDVFGSFKTIKCDGATEVTDPITDPTIVPTDSTAVIIWPKDNDAASYEIVIKKDGNVYIILTFNSNGQLIGISLAPGRGTNNAVMAATEVNGGFQFTITSLDPATTYSYDITSKREDSSIINSYDGEFTTTNGTDTPTDLLKVNGKDVKSNKILINGQMYIIREGKIFNAIGQKQ